MILTFHKESEVKTPFDMNAKGGKIVITIDLTNRDTMCKEFALFSLIDPMAIDETSFLESVLKLVKEIKKEDQEEKNK